MYNLLHTFLSSVCVCISAEPCITSFISSYLLSLFLALSLSLPHSLSIVVVAEMHIQAKEFSCLYGACA